MSLKLPVFFIITSLMCAFWALPGLHFGVWVDTQGPQVWLFGCSGFLGLLLVFLKKDQNQEIQLLLTNISPLSPLFLFQALIIFPLIFIPFHKDSLLSFLGPPNLGIGITSSISLLLLIAGILKTNCLQKIYFRMFLLFLSCSYGGFSYLSLGDPVHFSYLAIHDFSSWLSVVCLSLSALSLLQPLSKKLSYLEIMVALILLIISGNKSVQLGYIIASFIYGLLRFRFFSKKGFGVAILIVLPFVFTTAILYVPSETFLPTLYSRSFLLKAALLHLKENPLTFLIGQGYGQFGDIFLQNFTKLGLYFFNNNTYSPRDVLTHLDYNCMNIWVESILSSGILVGIAWFLLPLSLWINLPDFLKKKGIFLLIPLIAYDASWFHLPTTIPFLAIFYSCFIKQHQVNVAAISEKAGVLGIFCLFSSFLVFKDAHFHSIESWLTKKFPVSNKNQATLYEHQGPSQIYLTFYIQSILDSFDPNKPFPSKIYHDILKTCEVIKIQSLEFMIIQMSFFKLLHFYKLLPQSDYEILWEKTSYALYKKGPHRTDALAPFFLWALKQKTKNLKEFLEKILDYNPDDPIALWFYGMLLKKKKLTDLSQEYLLKAQEKGVKNFMPVTIKN